MSTSKFLKYSNACASVYLVPMFSDNYGLLLVDENENCGGHKRSATCIDPGDGAAILRAADELNLDLKYVLCTHKHNDHVGGNTMIRQHCPSVQIIGTAYEEIPEVNIKVSDGDVFSLGELQVQTIYTPCHTKGHVVYFVHRKDVATKADESRGEDKNTPILFTGDTLFVGGCGRFFEGTASDMLTNMDRIASLPAHTVVFCAHEVKITISCFIVNFAVPKFFYFYVSDRVLMCELVYREQSTVSCICRRRTYLHEST